LEASFQLSSIIQNQQHQYKAELISQRHDHLHQHHVNQQQQEQHPLDAVNYLPVDQIQYGVVYHVEKLFLSKTKEVFCLIEPGWFCLPPAIQEIISTRQQIDYFNHRCVQNLYVTKIGDNEFGFSRQ
jgi:hypothetical protein